MVSYNYITDRRKPEVKKYSFLGAGNMAYAIIGGMNGRAEITVYDKIASQYDKFGDTVKIAESAEDAVKRSDMIFLSVKPQNFAELLGQIKDSGVDLNGKTFVSIAAGVKISSICDMLGATVPVVRAMPNTPLLIGKGVTALSKNDQVSDTDFDEITNVFASLGKVIMLDESKMNAVISATSSAPAYIYYFIDCICKEAQAQGLTGNEMLEAVCEMVKGSADMVLCSGKTPEELIKMVTSPNGTTERAMEVFYEHGLKDTVSAAMMACTTRAQQLSDELDK